MRMYELILVSQSPRRRELLAKAGYKFRVEHIKVSEIIDENLNLDEAMIGLARQKAEAFADQNKHLKSQKIILLSADTLVVFNGQILGKPKNREEATHFLSILSQNTHSVKTSLCVYDLYKCQVYGGVETSYVSFKKLSSGEIDDYIESGEPMDKAGAYGIQGKAQAFVDKLEGSWDNVVGLPINLFERILKENDIELSK